MPVFAQRNTGGKKLALAQVNEIRRYYSEGASQGALARHYSVSIGTVGRIVRGESWQGIAAPREATQAELDASGLRMLAYQAEYDQKIAMTQEQRELAEALGVPMPPKRVPPPSLLDGGDSPDETKGGGIAGLTKALAPLQEAGLIVKELSEMSVSDEIKARAKAYGVRSEK